MDLYVPGKTPLHSLHPGAKILSFLLLSVSPVVIIDSRYMACLLIVAGLLGVITGAFRTLLRMAPLIGIFFIATVFFWAFFKHEGSQVFKWHFLFVSHESFGFGIAMGLRLVTLMVLGLTFLSIMPVEEFSDGCQSLGLGYRGSFALSLSFRLVPLFFKTTQTVVMAQRSRGLDLKKKGPLARIRGFFPLFIPVISLALRDAEGLSLALECKGFGSGPRSNMHTHRWRWFDAIAITLCLIVLAGSITLRVIKT